MKSEVSIKDLTILEAPEWMPQGRVAKQTAVAKAAGVSTSICTQCYNHPS